MLVNYKVANMMIVELGEGKQKLKLEPGINVIEDSVWEDAKKTLDAKIKSGVVVPIYKTTKKDGKEIEEPCKPDEIPNDKIDAVVEEIQSEAQADKFVASATKESVRAKGMNRKNKIAEELKDRESK
jgi:hypothetical protein